MPSTGPIGKFFFFSFLPSPPSSLQLLFHHQWPRTEGAWPGRQGPARAPLGGDALPGQVELDPLGARRVDGCERGRVQGEGAGAGAARGRGRGGRAELHGRGVLRRALAALHLQRHRPAAAAAPART